MLVGRVTDRFLLFDNLKNGLDVAFHVVVVSQLLNCLGYTLLSKFLEGSRCWVRIYYWPFLPPYELIKWNPEFKTRGLDVRVLRLELDLVAIVLEGISGPVPPHPCLLLLSAWLYACTVLTGRHAYPLRGDGARSCLTCGYKGIYIYIYD